MNEKKKDITPITEYAVYYVDLMPMLEERGMSKNMLCAKTGLMFNALQRYATGKIKRIDLDVISRICTVLECDIADIVKKA